MSESTQEDDDRRDADPTELMTFQKSLECLRPTPDGIDLAQLLFRAGQVSASRRSWVWPCAAAASTMLAATLAAVLLLRPAPQPVERIVRVYVQPSPPAPPPERFIPPNRETPAPLWQPSVPAGESEYLRLRREVLANGVDALPPPSSWPATTLADDNDNLLDLFRGSSRPWLRHLKRSLQSGDSPL